MRYKAFYYSGGNTDKPGPINIVVARKGIKLTIGMKQFISYSDITNASNDYRVIDKEFSAGKAVAGGILFGGLGALAGGAMGGEKVKAFLKLRYRFGTEEKELILGVSSGLAEKLKNEIDKKIGQAIS